MKQYTPENIESLPPNNIFVFGSNLAGRHGKFAALTAKQKFGAKYYVAEGLQGQSYAIPTCNEYYQPLSISMIEDYTDRFIEFATNHPELTFWVTKIACGSAGYRACDVGVLFTKAADLPNVILPIEFDKAARTIKKLAKTMDHGRF